MNPQAARTIQKPRTEDCPVWDLVFGIYGYLAVFIAYRMKLFSTLSGGPLSLQEVCDALQISRRPAETILAACTSLGFLKLEKERYFLTPLTEDYLLEDSPTYFGSYLDLIINNYGVASFESMSRAIQTDSPQAYGGGDIFKTHKEKADSARAFTRAMHSISMGPALAWPEKIDLSGYKQMLDIGGGSGAHSIGATLRWSNLRALVFDLAPVCEVAQEFIASQGSPGRVGTHLGDMWQDPFPSADLHFYSYIYHDWPPEKCRFLTQKSFASMPARGRIIIHEVLYNDDKTGPFAAAAYSMIMLGWATGQQYSNRELSAMLTEAGFTDVEVMPTFGHYSIVTALKP